MRLISSYHVALETPTFHPGQRSLRRFRPPRRRLFMSSPRGSGVLALRRLKPPFHYHFADYFYGTEYS